MLRTNLWISAYSPSISFEQEQGELNNTTMIENFFANSTWNDIVHYMVISMVLVAISPYGVFILRYLFSLWSGKPPPKIYRKSHNTPERAIAELEDAAIGNIRRLQIKIEEVMNENRSLIHENEALKDHIRSFDRTETDPVDAYDERNDEIHYDLMALGLKSYPMPSWNDIRSTYRNLVKIHHPDAGSQDPERFNQIHMAYERLKNVIKPDHTRDV